MSELVSKGGDWKQKLRHEMLDYWMTVLYLTIYFGVFMTYRRLILAHYQIDYLNYGVSIIQALILAKVILIGDLLRLSRGMENRPLIITTFVRAIMFTIWVAVFTLAEQTVRGLLRGEGWMGGIENYVNKRMYEFVASCLMVFFSFIPFFALKELNRVIGNSKIWNLFFYGPGKADVGRMPPS